MASRKIFVGSLPHGVSEEMLRATFHPYGRIDDVFVKQGCEPGRQWAFVTFSDPSEAQLAKEQCDRILTFPGQDRPCDVMVAKNQGMFGQGSNPGAAAPQADFTSSSNAPKKIFVGSLPDGIQESQLREEFSRYGVIHDIYIKSGCESGRQWGFVTFATSEEAQLAKVSTDRILVMPGASRACEVTLARNQGQFGQEPIAGGPGGAPLALLGAPSQGPKKIFVGSLPDNISEHMLRAHFESFGQIVDVFIKTPCELGRQWAFLTYATPEQANLAKESADRVLVVAGADKPCEVMLARNQGKNGQEPMTGGAGQDPAAAAAAMMGGLYGMVQPPPPFGAPAGSAWQCYQTATGLPYYHNHLTGVTQWERPVELGMSMMAVAPMGGIRYAPY